MAFKPFVPHLEPMRLPSADGAKVYEIPPIGIADGLRLKLSLEPDTGVELTENEQESILLGHVREQLIVDNVATEYYARVVWTALVNFRDGREAAEIIWETGIDPKAIAAWADAQESKPSPSTASENPIPSPASTTRTKTSRPSSTRSKSGTARDQRGTTS